MPTKSGLSQGRRARFFHTRMVALLISACLILAALIGGFVTGNMQPLQWILPCLLGAIAGQISISEHL